jgi:hypothetical protein
VAELIQVDGLQVTSAHVDVDYSYWPAHVVLRVSSIGAIKRLPHAARAKMCEIYRVCRGFFPRASRCPVRLKVWAILLT